MFSAIGVRETVSRRAFNRKLQNVALTRRATRRLRAFPQIAIRKPVFIVWSSGARCREYEGQTRHGRDNGIRTHAPVDSDFQLGLPLVPSLPVRYWPVRSVTGRSDSRPQGSFVRTSPKLQSGPFGEGPDLPRGVKTGL